jgi:hypothetical protein
VRLDITGAEYASTLANSLPAQLDAVANNVGIVVG